MTVRAQSHRVRTAAARTVARAAIHVSRHALRRRGRLAPHGQAPAAARFDVYTFVNDESQYAAFLRSAREAGFTGDVVQFIRLDDRREPRDPYALIRRLAADAAPRYSLVVHQDVRLDQGAGRRELELVVADLEARDPSWVVAGNAGTTPAFRRIRRVVDPHGGFTAAALPCAAVSLDENLLLFNPRCRPAVSAGLTGFHLYGTDVVLNALVRGGGAYVVDFPVTHLSGGALDGSYARARDAFVEAWRHRSSGAILRTPNETLVIGDGIARRILDAPLVRDWVRAWGEPVD